MVVAAPPPENKKMFHGLRCWQVLIRIAGERGLTLHELAAVMEAEPDKFSRELHNEMQTLMQERIGVENDAKKKLL